jgi:hypothetical protein
MKIFTLPGKGPDMLISKTTITSDVVVVFNTTTISNYNKSYKDDSVITGSFLFVHTPFTH